MKLNFYAPQILNVLQEDLENSLEKAAGQLNRIKSGDIEVQISIVPLNV